MIFFASCFIYSGCNFPDNNGIDRCVLQNISAELQKECDRFNCSDKDRAIREYSLAKDFEKTNKYRELCVKK